MDFNFYFWLDAFTKYLNGESDTPPAPPPQKAQQPNPAALSPAPKPAEPQKPPITPDNVTLKPEDIYMIPRQPEGGWQDPEPVERVILTKEEALAQGWRFCLKKAKITHYCGTEKDILGKKPLPPSGSRRFCLKLPGLFRMMK